MAGSASFAHPADVRRTELPAELVGRPFTRAQALAAGVSASRLRAGDLRRLLHDVYVEKTVPDSVELAASAVSLVLPADAVVGYTAGSWLLGADVRDRWRPEVEVIAQRGDQIRRAGVRATSALLEPCDVVEVHGVPVTSPTRTAFDLGRRKDLIEAVVGIDALLNRGGCRLDELTAYAAAHRGWRGIRYLDAALAHAEPLSESPMETRQRMRLVLAGLPRPRAQAPVADDNGYVFAYIDNGYEQWHVGADYDGEPHAARWRYDLERQERIRDRDWWHRRYTSLNIMNGWRQMTDQVGAALVAAGWRPA